MSYPPPQPGPPPYGSPYGSPYGAGPAPGPYPMGGYPAGPSRSFAPATGLGNAVSVLVGLATAVSLVGIVARLNRVGVVGDIDAGNISLDDVRTADRFVNATVVLFAVALIVTGIVWVVWQFRHAKNAEALSGQSLAPMGPGWAIGGWFVPVAAWFIPAMQLRASAKASDPDAPPGQGRAPGIIVPWAFAYGVGGLLLVISNSVKPRTDDFLTKDEFISRFKTADTLGAVSCIAFVLAGALAIVMVTGLSRRQARAAQLRAGGMPGGMPGGTPPYGYQPQPQPYQQPAYQQPAYQQPGYPPQGYPPPYQTPRPDQLPGYRPPTPGQPPGPYG